MRGFAFHFVADGVEQVRFAEAGAAVNEKRVIGIAGRLTYCDAACVGKAITGADDKIFKCIIRVQGVCVFVFWRVAVVDGELDGYKMARYLLCGASKCASAVFLQELGAIIIRAADFERPARQSNDAEIVKPLPRIDGVEHLCTVEYFRENIFYFTAGQDAFLYENDSHNKQRLSLTNNIRVIETAEKTSPSVVL